LRPGDDRLVDHEETIERVAKANLQRGMIADLPGGLLVRLDEGAAPQLGDAAQERGLTHDGRERVVAHRVNEIAVRTFTDGLERAREIAPRRGDHDGAIQVERAQAPDE